jgi:hypothetical protein
VIVTALLLVACGATGVSPAGVATTTPRPMASSPATASVPPPSSSPSLPPGACTFPLKVRIDHVGLVAVTMTMPGGTSFHQEQIENGDPGLYTIGTNPQLQSGDPDFSRTPAGQWVPVPAQNVSPDGTRYADVDTESQTTSSTTPLHLTDIRSGSRRVLATLPGFTTILGWIGSSIYVSVADQLRMHVLALDPSSGTSKELPVAPNSEWTRTIGGAVWGRLPTSDDVAQWSELARLDPASGNVSTPLQLSEKDAKVIGVTRAEEPIVRTVDANNKVAILVLAADGSPRTIYTGDKGFSASPAMAAAGPGSDVIVLEWNGLYRIHADGTTSKVGEGLTVPIDDGSTGLVARLAGACS